MLAAMLRDGEFSSLPSIPASVAHPPPNVLPQLPTDITDGFSSLPHSLRQSQFPVDGKRFDNTVSVSSVETPVISPSDDHQRGAGLHQHVHHGHAGIVPSRDMKPQNVPQPYGQQMLPHHQPPSGQHMASGQPIDSQTPLQPNAASYRNLNYPDVTHVSQAPAVPTGQGSGQFGTSQQPSVPGQMRDTGMPQAAHPYVQQFPQSNQGGSTSGLPRADPSIPSHTPQQRPVTGYSQTTPSSIPQHYPTPSMLQSSQSTQGPMASPQQYPTASNTNQSYMSKPTLPTPDLAAAAADQYGGPNQFQASGTSTQLSTSQGHPGQRMTIPQQPQTLPNSGQSGSHGQYFSTQASVQPLPQQQAVPGQAPQRSQVPPQQQVIPGQIPHQPQTHPGQGQYGASQTLQGQPPLASQAQGNQIQQLPHQFVSQTQPQQFQQPYLQPGTPPVQSGGQRPSFPQQRPPLQQFPQQPHQQQFPTQQLQPSLQQQQQQQQQHQPKPLTQQHPQQFPQGHPTQQHSQQFSQQQQQQLGQQQHPQQLQQPQSFPQSQRPPGSFAGAPKQPASTTLSSALPHQYTGQPGGYGQTAQTSSIPSAQMTPVNRPQEPFQTLPQQPSAQVPQTQIRPPSQSQQQQHPPPPSIQPIQQTLQGPQSVPYSAANPYHTPSSAGGAFSQNQMIPSISQQRTNVGASQYGQMGFGNQQPSANPPQGAGSGQFMPGQPQVKVQPGYSYPQQQGGMSSQPTGTVPPQQTIGQGARIVGGYGQPQQVFSQPSASSTGYSGQPRFPGSMGPSGIPGAQPGLPRASGKPIEQVPVPGTQYPQPGQPAMPRAPLSMQAGSQVPFQQTGHLTPTPAAQSYGNVQPVPGPVSGIIHPGGSSQQPILPTPVLGSTPSGLQPAAISQPLQPNQSQGIAGASSSSSSGYSQTGRLGEQVGMSSVGCGMAPNLSRQSSSLDEILSSSPDSSKDTAIPAPVIAPKVLTAQEKQQQKEEAMKNRGMTQEPEDPYPSNSALNKFVTDVERFGNYVQDLTAVGVSGHSLLDSIWKTLMDNQDLDGKKSSIAIARCYPMKNRDPDIMPYDDTRVILTSQKDDYINASWINDLAPSCPKFITAQAPLGVTINDFWAMVYEQGSEVVVMVTSEYETGKKYPCYWPQEKGKPVEHGHFLLELQSIKYRELWTERIIYLKNVENKQGRNIVHLQFKNWPVSGFPENVSHIVRFITEVHSFYKQQRSLLKPVIVQCGSGIGRSGAFLLTYTAMQEVAHGNGLIDIPVLARRMLQKRKNIFQNKEQIKFCYDALLYFAEDFLRKRDVLVRQPHFTSQVNKAAGHTPVHSADDIILGSVNLQTLQQNVGKLGDKHLSDTNAVSSEIKGQVTQDITCLPPEGSNVSSLPDLIQQPSKNEAVTSGGGPGQTAVTGEGPVTAVDKMDVHSPQVRSRSGSASSGQSTGSGTTSSSKPSPQHKSDLKSLPPSLAELANPNTFSIGSSNAEKKRITKASFASKKSTLADARSDPGDPLSNLDPLWSLNKEKK